MDQLCVVPPQEIQIAIEESFVLLEFSVELLLFRLDLLLELLHQNLHLQIQLHPHVLQTTVQLLE